MGVAVLAPELELASLWDNEGDEIVIHLEPPYYRDGGSVVVWLNSNSPNRYDIDKPSGVDDVTLTWEFHGDNFAEAIDLALGFARELAALKPPDSDL